MCEVLSSSPQHQYHPFQGLQEYCCFMGWKSLELKTKPVKILNSGIFTMTLSYFCWGLGKGLETQERFCGDRTKGKTLSRLNHWRSCFLSLTHKGGGGIGRTLSPSQLGLRVQRRHMGWRAASCAVFPETEAHILILLVSMVC